MEFDRINNEVDKLTDKANQANQSYYSSFNNVKQVKGAGFEESKEAIEVLGQ